jgi:hypothetical protein
LVVLKVCGLFLVVVFGLCPVVSQAQGEGVSAVMEGVDSVMGGPKGKVFAPDPTKAVLLSALFPGGGQVYNRKFWKLPLVYGAVIGCVYAVSWNGTQYRGYRSAYADLLDGDAATGSWRSYNYKYYGGSEEEPELWSASAVSEFGNRLKNGKDNFRRSLELSYIVSAGVYVLCMIDAYVDAQLFEFDIGEDLSLKVGPAVMERSGGGGLGFGLAWCVSFK